MKSCLLACAVVLLLPLAAWAEFTPDFRVHPDDVTVMMVVDARRSEGLPPFQAGAHGKFFVTGWRRADQHSAWKMTAPAADDYEVRVLLRRSGNRPLKVEVSLAAQHVAAVLPADETRWARLSLEGTLRLAQGEQEITLRLMPVEGEGEFDAQVMSVELVRGSVRKQLHEAALAMRSDTKWFQDAKYGFMFHWTAQSMPRSGEPKPYDQAVQDFDVEAFANQAAQGGAGFVVLTTAHALQYFPAPLESLDKILPGRTSRRDLVADLAAALNRRGIKLMLYYHLGAASDPKWLEATGFWKTDTTQFLGNWQAIVGEAGKRYGDNLAGWWFDDGTINYYYRSPAWEKLAAAAKAGSPQRLIAFNPWELPNATEFQDYHCGEGDQDPSGGGELAIGGDGRFTRGHRAGLQASVCLITEGDWVHSAKNTIIGKPQWSAEQTADFIRRCVQRKNVPIFNMEIYQEGSVSPTSIEMFQKAKQLLQ